MNIDDFIFADEGAGSVHDSSPQPPAASSSLSGPQTAAVKKNRSSKALAAAAIPIKGRKGSTNQFVAQSVPVPPHHQRGQNDEFHYVPRHDRKTSIDDRRVSRLHPSAAKHTIPFPFLFSFFFFLRYSRLLIFSHLLLLWRACTSFFLFPPLLIFCPLWLWWFFSVSLLPVCCLLPSIPSSNHGLILAFPFSLDASYFFLILRCHNLCILLLYCLAYNG